MKYIIPALQSEVLKIRKSKVTWITLLAFTLIPIIAGFFMFVLKNPEFAKSSGLLGAKAQIAGEATWPSYLSLLSQMISVGGLLLFGFVNAWVFGREFADKTSKDLLALPNSRAVIVSAKLIAIILINVLFSIYIAVLGFLIGWIIDLPEWSLTIATHGLNVFFIATILTIVLSLPVSFFASYCQGYLAALGFVILTLILSQIVAAAGFGESFPWSIPALYSGISGVESTLKFSSIAIVIFTSLIGMTGTFLWWRFADHR